MTRDEALRVLGNLDPRGQSPKEILDAIGFDAMQETVRRATDAARKDALANHDLARELEQARADVLKLRPLVRCEDAGSKRCADPECSPCNALADTEHYETHR